MTMIFIVIVSMVFVNREVVSLNCCMLLKIWVICLMMVIHNLFSALKSLWSGSHKRLAVKLECYDITSILLTIILPCTIILLTIILPCTSILLTIILPCTSILLTIILPCTIILLTIILPCTSILLTIILPCTSILLTIILPCTIILLTIILPCTIILLKWISCFLSNRLEWVKLGTCCSRKSNVISGIPQDSILVPILFTIYTNDLPNYLTSQCKMFADDIKIYSKSFNHDSTNRY